MPLVTPAKKVANGRDTWGVCLAGTNILVPKITELNATTGLNLAGILLSDYEGITTNVEKVTLPKVLLETTSTEVVGEVTNSMADMSLTFQPQAATGSDGKKAWELFQGGFFTGWAWRRQDVVATTGDVTTGQFVDVVPVTLVRNAPGKTSTGPDGIYIFTASVSITGAPAFNVATVAS